jgi:preprotein translocase subunit Sss1
MENYVLNPYTDRLIKKGSKVHKRLLSAKLLDDEKPSTPEKSKIIEADTPKLQKNTIVTGKQVLKAARRPTREETINKVTDIAVSSIREREEQMSEREMTDQEMDKYIRKMIAEKLVESSTSKVISTKQASLQDRLKQKIQMQKGLEELEELDDFDSYFE